MLIVRSARLTVIILLIAVFGCAGITAPSGPDAADSGRALPILYEGTNRPHEVVAQYEWNGKAEKIADILGDMVAKAKNTPAEAFLVKETVWNEKRTLTRVVGQAIRYAKFENSSMCRNCHENIFQQHSQSMHSKSASNPVFLAQYFKELIPGMETDSHLASEAKRCTACHNPIEFLYRGEHMISRDLAQREQAAVTCDFCHSIRGFRGKHPGDGDYISEPGDVKSGPLQKETWHNQFSRFVNKSEFCGICHNATNHNGLVVKSTYDEWKESPYAAGKIQCQDCHMNREGFLTDGKAEFDRGELVTANMFGKKMKQRKLYSHVFPGAHSHKQIEGSLSVSLKTDGDAYAPGDSVVITATVDNSRAGHKMPTGSVDLRALWLDVRAYAGATEIPVELVSGETGSGFGISGAMETDLNFAADIPKGKRVYRAVLADREGAIVLASYEATSVVFDNRLNAAESRDERYYFVVPSVLSGPLVVQAALKYISYPSAFARKLDIPTAESHEIASSSRTIEIRTGR